jgi:hypothetical protein
MDYNIDFEVVSGSKDFQSSTRLLAVDMQKNGYANLAEFFRCLPDDVLQTYMNIAEDDESDSFSEIIVLSSMLAMAEGLDSELDDDKMDVITERVNQLIMLLACESLHRKGLVKFYRENISFGEDMKDRVIVEKLND